MSRLMLFVAVQILFLGCCTLVMAQPAATLTPEQKEKLKERDRLKKEADALKGGKHAEHEALLRKIVAIEHEVLGADHDEVFASLQIIGRLQQERAAFAEAKKTYGEILDASRKKHGPNNWRSKDAERSIAYVDLLSGLTPELRKRVREADALFRKGEEHHKNRKHKESVELLRQSLKMYQEVLGPDHMVTVDKVAYLGGVLSYLDEFAEARNHTEKALALRRKVLGDNHPKVAMAYNTLGNQFQDEKKFDEAHRQFEEALRIRIAVFGNDHVEVGKISYNLGNLSYTRGGYAVARPHLEKALAIFEKGPPEHQAFALKAHRQLANLLSDHGNYPAAKHHFQQALAICRKTVGEKDAITANTLSSLGYLYHLQGDFPSAQQQLRQALAIQKAAVGDKHSDTAWTINRLGLIYQEQGDFQAARKHYEDALTIIRLNEKKDGYSAAVLLNNLGWLMQSHNRLKEARSYLEQALAIYEKVAPPNDIDMARTNSNLAFVARVQGRYADSLRYYERALAVRKKVLGDEHERVAWTTAGLAGLHEAQGDAATALPLFERSLQIYKKAVGDNHPNVGATLSDLARLYQSQGNLAKARSHVEQSLLNARRNLDLSAMAQSERQQLLMNKACRGRLDEYLGLARPAEIPVEQVYAEVLAWKGAVLARQRQLHLERGNPKVATLATELRTTTAHLASLAFATPSPSNRNAWAKQMSELSEKKETLERDLALLSETFRQDKALARLKPNELREAMPAGTVLIDYLEYQHRSPDPKAKGRWQWENRLLAFVIRAEQPPVLVELGSMAPLEKVIDRWRLTLKQTSGSKEQQAAGLELRERAWQPLEKHVAGAKTVLIAPDGALGRVPFAALPGRKAGEYLIEEVALAVVPVPRLLPEFRTAKPPAIQTQSLLLLGDVDFDAVAGTSADSTGRVAPRGERTGTQKKWSSLPGTRTEIAAIKDTFLQQFEDGKVKDLRKAKATESAMREFAPKHQILHLATHGFFARPEMRSVLDSDANKERTGADVAPVEEFHPGLLSGLVLAGANREPTGGQDDGILTALEVAELDLRKVELAVLSACETGLGEVAGGEGILGLQRAFQVAGARSVVASLWSVGDEPTAKLMIRFYENLWDKKMPKAEALRDAQLWMLREGSKRGIVRIEGKDAPSRLPPYYWAAFVLSGDWR